MQERGTTFDPKPMAEPDAIERWADEGGTTAARDKLDPATGRKWSEKHQAFLPYIGPETNDTEPLFVRPMVGRRAEIVECNGGFVVVLHTPETMNTEYEIHKDVVNAAQRAMEFLDAC